ncbi:beta-lactamase family protein [Rothia sp. AR01]|uniref:Beta-lactamase family protein n=1 Tax=Rothia santali TaxID=2949643 RepID=A0A9X2HBG7_9MICC|nr:serine hydrolase domain-containing protein [Rothia santali]MCP3424632.1 beta-lactamase family protein [Rothia santali]
MPIDPLPATAAPGDAAAFRAADRRDGTGPTDAPDAFQRRLDELVEIGFPAALGTRTTTPGDHESRASGVADLATGRPARPDETVRIASNTKMFTAVVVLQLVDEGRVRLDEPVEEHLPGLLRGEGIDGARITVRNLLQQTSGLPDYVGDLLAESSGFWRDIPPRDLLDLALGHPAAFAPGERWGYSNTNYVVLGLLVERVTGGRLEDEVTRRVVERLGLERTRMPRGGERGIPEPRPSGYHVGADGGLEDWTGADPSSSWAAGSVLSTPAELNLFMQALLRGELTSAASLEEMMTTVPADETFWPGVRYGLGLQEYPLSDGGVAWGHGGDFPGYQSRNAVREDGRAVTIVVTALPPAVIDPTDVEALMGGYRAVTAALDEALCAGPAAPLAG